MGTALQDRLSEIVALTEQRQRIDVRLKALRSDLLALCRERRLRGVVGETHEFRISRWVTVIVPTCGDPKRRSLEACLKRLGYWAQVSQLNRSALQQLLKYELPPDDFDQITRYVSHGVVHRGALLSLDRGDRVAACEPVRQPALVAPSG